MKSYFRSISEGAKSFNSKIDAILSFKWESNASNEQNTFIATLEVSKYS